VKFHNERAVRQFVTEAIRQTLLGFHTSAAPQTSPALEVSPAATPSPPGIPPAAATREFPSFTALTGTPLESRLNPAPVPAASTPTPAPV